MISLLGTIQAGFPTEAEEDALDTISLDEFILGNKDASYMLRMRGNSMIDSGIFDGDLVIVERALKPKAGDVVIAVIEGEHRIMHLEDALEGAVVEAVVRAVVRKYR